MNTNIHPLRPISHHSFYSRHVSLWVINLFTHGGGGPVVCLLSNLRITPFESRTLSYHVWPRLLFHNVLRSQEQYLSHRSYLTRFKLVSASGSLHTFIPWSETHFLPSPKGWFSSVTQASATVSSPQRHLSDQPFLTRATGSLASWH